MIAIEAGIVVRDADAASQFYVSAMGLTVERVLEFPQGKVVRMRSGEARLKVFQPAGELADGRPTDRWSASTGFAYAAFHVDDADAAFARLTAAGATVITPVNQHRPDARSAIVADPWGNVWEILEEQR